MVPGMACSTCANNITNAVKTVDVHALVKTDLQTKMVSVETQAERTTIEQVLITAGYPPTEFSTELVEQKL
jgi:copper chaperone